ncbi:phage tail protein [Corynebacterium ciconiae]|uniref:Gp37-like protein n=1 Tax=Corynebacterium ciconiae TaxID=227319 RepID=UPI002648E36F|nr:phage tail protein [Corynebacterium ciconiae]
MMAGDALRKLDDHLSEVYAQVDYERQARAAQRVWTPLVRLWDGDWNLRGVVSGALDMQCEWKYNEVGAAFITLPYDHHLARWALDHRGRDTKNIHVTFDRSLDGQDARWGGRCQSVTLVKNADGTRHVELKFLHDLKELEHILVWPNPFLPAGVQWPKAFALAGPLKTILKTTLLVNLMRLHGNLWQLPDDPLDPKTWVEGLTPWNWSIVVAPGSILLDDSQWGVISSRMKSFMEVAAPALDDAGLMLTCRRWLHGDPKPKGWIGPMRQGQLVVDVEDKSGVFEQTAIGGTIFGGMVRTVTKLADNVIDDVVTVVANPTVPVEHAVSRFLGTHPRYPWVVFRDGDFTPVESGSWTWQPATVGQITAGGRSAPGVNTAVSMVTQLVGNLVGSVFLMPAAGGIVDTALKPLYEDVFLAFGSVKSPLRTMMAGWSYYHEGWAEGAESAWSFSGLVAMREAFYKTRARDFASLSINDGAPYIIADQGRGHIWVGDRAGVWLEGMPNGYYPVLRMSQVVMSCTRDEPVKLVASFGDPRADQSPLARLFGQSKQVFETLKELGVWA